MKKIIVSLGIVFIFLVGYIVSSEMKNQEIKMEKSKKSVSPSPARVELTLITVYDNNQYDSKLKTGFGFGCLAKVDNKNILFDTGADSPTLLSNMEKLGIEPKEIDMIFLSHIHDDHVGGLWGLLERNGEVKVYIPASFPDSFREKIRSYGTTYQNIENPVPIMEEIYSTGELGNLIKEQALVIKTKKGLIVLTGCAHPGVVNIVKKAKDIINEEVYLVMGGFHLGGTSDSELKNIIRDFQELGVQKVAPCHCSGDRCQELFKQEYQENYIENGVGRVIKI